MKPATPRVRARAPSRLRFALGMMLLGVLLAPLGPPERSGAQAPADAQRDGLFVSVPSQITSGTVADIERKIKDAVERQGRRVSVVVFDFNPNNQPGGEANVHACMQLMDFIRKVRTRQFPTLGKIKTVAFVHDEVTKHTVLPVMACEELIMAKQAKLGQVLAGQEGPLSEGAKKEYEWVASQWPSPDLVWKMVYPDLALAKVKTKEGVRYIDRKKVAAAADKGEPYHVLEAAPPKLGVGMNQTLIGDAEAHEYELCKRNYNSRAEVRAAYNLSPMSMREDALAGRTPVVWRIDLRGAIDKGRLDSLDRRIRTAIGRNANVIILHLDCEAGETKDILTAANALRGLKDEGGKPVKTIAYVPPQRKLGAATFLAVACSEIAMSSSAVLGDFKYLKGEGEANLDQKRAMLMSLAEEQGYPPLLFRAMLDDSVVLYRVRHAKEVSNYQIITAEDLKKDQDSPAPQWVEPTRIPRSESGFVTLTADLARAYGVARYADVESPEELYTRYEFDGSKVTVSRDDWMDHVAEFFRQPLVSVFLIMIGIAGLIIELKMPGIYIGGIIAALCFVLFFWAHSFTGQFTVLAIMLFVLGLALIVIEVFFIPGFGVMGISGIVLIVLSLVLVTLEHWPQTSGDWLQLGSKVSMFGVGLVGAIILALVLAWYLPHIPYASRMVLKPPGEGEDSAGNLRDGSPVANAALLGAIGVAATPLRPAGKARIGDDYVDVIAEGTFVTPGARIQVIEVEGNRVVVKEM